MPQTLLDEALHLEAPAAGVNFQFLELIESFLQNSEVQQAAQNGTAGHNLGALLNTLARHVGAEEATVYAVGDTEGRVSNDFETLKEQGVIRNGAVQDESSSLLFMGDLGDRGPAALKTAHEMLALKASAPDRVGFIWGNRDLGKLALHNDLPKLRNFTGETGELYSQWLLKKLPEEQRPIQSEFNHFALGHLNTDANRVQYWLETHSVPNALEFHRQGLEEGRGAPVDLEQAAQDYVQSWRPGGVFFEFLTGGGRQRRRLACSRDRGQSL